MLTAFIEPVVYSVRACVYTALSGIRYMVAYLGNQLLFFESIINHRGPATVNSCSSIYAH